MGYQSAPRGIKFCLLTQSEFDIEETFVLLQLGRLEGEQHLDIVRAEDLLHAQSVELEALEATADCKEMIYI